MKKRDTPWTPLSFDGLRRVSLKERQSKVRIEDFGQSWQPGGSFAAFLETLPGILAVNSFRKAVGAVADAIAGERTVLLGMGAHPIKVGLSPIIADALKRGLFTGLALNGAGIIHDVEVALAGKTSEDVDAHLGEGCFGMAGDTAEFIHGAVAEARSRGNVGLGRAVGERLLREKVPFAHLSLLATAAEGDLPVTVHVAFGTDIIHMHPAMDGAAMGALTHHDFRLFCRLVSTLKGGVYINLGSAVILPEVFLKAVSVVRNLGHSLDGITTVSMDFQRHYRPETNVVRRPTMGTGTGISLVGHHEIMFPLLVAAVLERLFPEG